jgi:hypothetical protein
MLWSRYIKLCFICCYVKAEFDLSTPDFIYGVTFQVWINVTFCVYYSIVKGKVCTKIKLLPGIKSCKFNSAKM